MTFDSRFDTEEIDFVHIAQIMQRRRRDSTGYYLEALCMQDGIDLHPVSGQWSDVVE